jgi:hypothetical protein
MVDMLDRTDPTASNPYEQTARLNQVNAAEQQAKKEGGPGPEDSSGPRAVAGAALSLFIGPVSIAADVILGAMSGGAKGGTTNLGRFQQKPQQTLEAVNLLGGNRGKPSQISKFLGRVVKPTAKQLKINFARAANWKKIKDEKALALRIQDNPYDGGEAATKREERDLKKDAAPAKAVRAAQKPRPRAFAPG